MLYDVRHPTVTIIRYASAVSVVLVFVNALADLFVVALSVGGALAVRYENVPVVVIPDFRSDGNGYGTVEQIVEQLFVLGVKRKNVNGGVTLFAFVRKTNFVFDIVVLVNIIGFSEVVLIEPIGTEVVVLGLSLVRGVLKRVVVKTEIVGKSRPNRIKTAKNQCDNGDRNAEEGAEMPVRFLLLFHKEFALALFLSREFAAFAVRPCGFGRGGR